MANKNGVPEYIDPTNEQTRKIVVGRYAFQDVCKCGATVHLTPDETTEPPAEIFYDRKTFQILACPKCVTVLS